MATWTELCDHIKANWPILEEEETHIAIEFGFDTGRTQRVMVWDDGPTDHGHWVALKTPIAKVSEINPTVLLQRNDQLLAGSIGTYENGLVIYHYQIRIDDLDEAELEVALEMVAVIGDGLELEYRPADRS